MFQGKGTLGPPSPCPGTSPAAQGLTEQAHVKCSSARATVLLVIMWLHWRSNAQLRKKYLLYKQVAVGQLLPVSVFLLGSRHNKVVSVYTLA